MGDPREAFRDIQRRLQNSRRGGNFSGGPKLPFGVGAGVAIVVGGYILVNNALFNGPSPEPHLLNAALIFLSGWWS